MTDTPSSSGATPVDAAAVKITATENGPLEVIGAVSIVAADGVTLRSGEKFYLCRCGQSKTKPYCDGSHRATGFTDSGLGPKR